MTTKNKSTDIFELVRSGDVDAVRAAIANGADVNARDKDGVTADEFRLELNQDEE